MIGDERILTNCKDLSIEPLGDKWKLSWGKNTIIAEQVVTTCPAYALPKLLSFLPKAQLDDLSNLYYAPVIEIGVGMKNTGDVHWNAFGGLVPSKEKQNVLGILMPRLVFRAVRLRMELIMRSSLVVLVIQNISIRRMKN